MAIRSQIFRDTVNPPNNTPTYNPSPFSIDTWENEKKNIQQTWLNMVSNNMRIDKLDDYQIDFDSFNNNVTPKTQKKINSKLNITRDTIALSLEVSKRSGVPVLFLSNPGEGKTTGVMTFGKYHKLHVEFLMGSQYTQEDVLGFMTNTGKEYLEVKIPEWYYRIMEYTKYHWEIKDDPNFELGYTERKKLIDEKKLYFAYKDKKLTEEQLLDMDIPFDKIDIDARVKEIDKELEDRFVWTPPRGTILFLDELSAAAPTVQAALLRLCHEKKLRGNNSLPKNCIVCAAGNFKRNLPSFMEIIAPELNRFCIINLLRGNPNSKYENIGKDLVFEATQDFYENINNFPEYKDPFEFSQSMKTKFLEKYRNGLIKLFEEYSKDDSPNGILNLRNTNFDGMFDGLEEVPEISNFISVRSISYFARVLRALCELRISPSYLDDAYKKFSVGLLGLGTNSWDSKSDDRELQISTYQKSLNFMVGDILSEFNHPSKDSITLSTIPQEVANKTEIKKGSLAETINNYINGNSKDLQDVIVKTQQRFPTNAASAYYALQTVFSGPLLDIIDWRADYEAVKMLIMTLDNAVDKEYLDIYTNSLKTVCNNYEFYYDSSLSSITLEDLKGV